MRGAENHCWADLVRQQGLVLCALDCRSPCAAPTAALALWAAGSHLEQGAEYLLAPLVIPGSDHCCH